MNAPQRPLVIAVAGPIGGGKSTLTLNLARLLPGTAPLHFDDYETASYTPMRELEAWLARGGPLSEFEAPGLAEAVTDLLNGKTVYRPRHGTALTARHYVLLEIPVGREHKPTAPLIDVLIWVDTPPEVALARHIKKLTATMVPGTPEANPEAAPNALRFVRWLEHYLDNYANVVRRVLQVQKKAVGDHADITVDGSADPQSITRQALEALGPWLRGRPGPAQGSDQAGLKH